jgi:hypothetical protein
VRPISASADRLRVDDLLAIEPGHGAEAAGVALPAREVVAPRARQAQEADGVTGRRGIEQHMIVLRGQVGVREQASELVEARDLGGAGAGKPLRDRAQLIVRDHAAERAENALAVLLDGLLRVDLQRDEAGHVGDRRHAVADSLAKDLPNVGRRVRADQQHLLASVDELERGRADDGGLADAAFPGEEDVARGILEEAIGGHEVGLVLRDRRRS